MKMVLMILGAITLLIVVVVVTGIVVVTMKGGKLDKESKQYADAAVSAIITNWDVKELEGEAHVEDVQCRITMSL